MRFSVGSPSDGSAFASPLARFSISPHNRLRQLVLKQSVADIALHADDRPRGGSRETVLAGSLIGAHAQVERIHVGGTPERLHNNDP